MQAASIQLGEAQYSDFGFWDKVKMALRPTHIFHDVPNWEYVHYKVYKSRNVIIAKERQH